MSQLSTYPLRLPRSMRLGVERFSKEARADMDGFDQLMQRSGSEPPRDGDTV